MAPCHNSLCLPIRSGPVSGALVDGTAAKRSLNVVVLYNDPVLSPDNPDWASEAGVLETVDAVSEALTAHGHRVERLPVRDEFASILQRLSTKPQPDVVFNLCEGLQGTGGGEAQVTGLIELSGVPMTGGQLECLALARDKARTKWLLSGAGLPTAEFFYLEADDPLPEAVLREALRRSPAIIKPACEDGSLGIGPDSVVREYAQLERQVQLIRHRYGPVLIEQFIAGREFNAAIVALPEPRLLPLAEIVFDSDADPHQQLVTYDAKWATNSAADLSTPSRCPADVMPELATEISRVALAAFRVVGCRDYARIDLRVDAKGRVFILEVNGNPDLSPSAGLARSLRAAGIAYDEFINQMTEQAARRRSPR
jgi:D-alanine-D-alanine ligase